MGQGLRTSRYTVNSLNQYTQRTVPGAVDVLGEAAADAVVTVNDQATERHGGYYRKELRADNTPSAVWLGVTNRAVNTNGSADMLTNVTGNLFLARTPEVYQYDADGNLTNDGRFQYTWDAENRLIAAEAKSGSGVPPESLFKETWSHLPDGRWAERVISNKVEGVWTLVSTQRFAWDGKVLLAVLDATNGIVQSYVRGLDLSGSLQGAGGVGGLLMVSEISNAQIENHFAVADGNGNITTLASATNASVTARYEYGPFGETIRMTGPMASKNLLRFSTQFADEVIGTVKYLYRDYRTIEGMWLSKDPIEENGGLNHYGFVGNNPISNTDKLGLAVEPDSNGNCPKRCCKKGGPAEQLVSISICTRKLGGTGPGIPVINHQYICCGGANVNCFGVTKYTPSCMAACQKKGLSDKECEKQCYAKKGTPIEPEVSPTGTCEIRCVSANEKNTVCNGKQSMPEDYHIGPHGIDCQEWAENSTSTRCK